MRNSYRIRAVLFLLVAMSAGLSALAQDRPLKSESFDKDPNWDARHNRVPPAKPLKVTQDFGYSATAIAGKGKGEIGGVIQRSTTPASYAAPLVPAITLEQKISASGTFAVTAAQPGAGVFFGFFNASQPGGSGRPIGSLGLNFDFEGKGGRLAVRLITGGNKSCGTFITPYVPGKYRPTPIKLDGTHYRWTLNYDPQAAEGDGQFVFTFASDNHPKTDIEPGLSAEAIAEARARFPHTTTFTVNLPPGYRKEGASFDRFGIINMMKAGGTVKMYFDDLTFNGKTEDFTQDPAWAAAGNRVTFEDRELTGAHDFGYSTTNLAGGAGAGEIGGGLWRSGNYGYYADRVGPLNLDQPLQAQGTVRLVTAGPDSDMCIGWFGSASRDKEPSDTGDFVGVHIGGPTRVGHYFSPVVTPTGGKTKAKLDKAPILTPGKTFKWSVAYDPAANAGNGELRVTLGDETAVLPLKPGQKKTGATLDRFGLFTTTAGGQMVKIYFDDLKYTAAK